MNHEFIYHFASYLAISDYRLATEALSAKLLIA
jgi:hypothetical protein